MTRGQMPARTRLSRRSALGLLGAAPLAVSGAAALARPAQASTGNADVPPGQPPAALLPEGAYDQFVRGLADRDLFSGTVLLAWHGEPVLVRSYQQADKKLGIPNQASTLFNPTRR